MGLNTATAKYYIDFCAEYGIPYHTLDGKMVNFQRELLQLAAANHLTVNFHGVAAPTGLERTFPNLLNSEAVRNLEYDKWDENGVTPEHDVTVRLAESGGSLVWLTPIRSGH